MDANEDEYWIWGTQDEHPRLLHTMIRVADLDRSLAFYCDGMGMRQLHRLDVEAGKFSIVFVNFTEDYRSGAIELTWNWEGEANEKGYTHGSGYGHVAIGVPDIRAMCERLRKRGYEISTEPKQMLPGAPMLAFVKDPDGYAIELIETSRDAS